MSKDVRRGDPELLAAVFRALVDFEGAITFYQSLEPTGVARWKANRDQLMRAWDSVTIAVGAYARSCPETNGEDDEPLTEPRSFG